MYINIYIYINFRLSLVSLINLKPGSLKNEVLPHKIVVTSNVNDHVPFLFFVIEIFTTEF